MSCDYHLRGGAAAAEGAGLTEGQLKARWARPSTGAPARGMVRGERLPVESTWAEIEGRLPAAGREGRGVVVALIRRGGAGGGWQGVASCGPRSGGEGVAAAGVRRVDRDVATAFEYAGGLAPREVDYPVEYYELCFPVEDDDTPLDAMLDLAGERLAQDVDTRQGSVEVQHLQVERGEDGHLWATARVALTGDRPVERGHFRVVDG